jgi:hypothetical protein
VSSYSVSKPLAILFIVCGLALIFSNVLLARRLSQLSRLDDLLNASNKLETGGVVPPLVGYDLSGQKVTYSYGDDSRDTMLLVLSPGCHACDENWPKWNRLIKSLDTQSTRLVIANIASIPVTPDYISRHQISGIPLVAEVSAESLQAYRLGYTPQTILISHDGRVRKVYTGVLNDNTFALDAGCSMSPSGHCVSESANLTASGAF